MADIVGGIDALEDLALEPLEEEPFDRERVSSDDAALVRELLDRIEGFCGPSVNSEFLTILRRLVAVAATPGDHPLRRRSSPQRIAAALVWIALKGNMAIGSGQRYSGEIRWSRLGVTSRAELGRRIAESLCMTTDEHLLGRGGLPSDPIVLGDAGLLTARWIFRRRDQSLEVAAHLEANELVRRPVVYRGDGRVEVRGRDVKVGGAMKGLHEGNRATVMVLLGESPDELDDVLALSVPDAHRLVAQLQAALDAPLQLRK